MREKVLFFSSLLLLAATAAFGQSAVFLREDFNDLSLWRPLSFPKVEKQSRYEIVIQGPLSYLRAESQASASGLVLKREFNVYQYPIIRWRWKVDSVYQKGDVRTKDGDDYPFRVYVIFKSSSSDEGLIEKLKRSTFRMFYGESLPSNSLNYVWANSGHPDAIITSPYTDHSKIILLQRGTANIGRWIDEEVNILKDFDRAFNRKPPETATVALMNDSDNTGESSVSYMDWIEIRKDY